MTTAPVFAPTHSIKIFERFYTDRPHQRLWPELRSRPVDLASRSSRRMAGASGSKTAPRRRLHGETEPRVARRPLHCPPAGDVMVSEAFHHSRHRRADRRQGGADPRPVRDPGKSRLALGTDRRFRAPGTLPFARLIGDDRVHVETADGPPAGAARRHGWPV